MNNCGYICSSNWGHFFYSMIIKHCYLEIHINSHWSRNSNLTACMHSQYIRKTCPCADMWIYTPLCDRLWRKVAAIDSPTENHRMTFLAIWPSQWQKKIYINNKRDRYRHFCEQMWISRSCYSEVVKFHFLSLFFSNKFT